MSDPDMDRHTIATLQRAVKKKARKAPRFPATLGGERILYCMRCLRSNHEVEGMVWEPFLCLCYDCIDNLAIFKRHLCEQKQRHTQAQSEPDEGESS